MAKPPPPLFLARESYRRRRLGDHQDACIAQEELARHRDTLATSGRERRTFERLIAIEAKRAARLRRRFPKDWRRFEAASARLARRL